MQDNKRGKVHSPNLANQLRDFSGLRYGKITPTDIDAFLDFGDRLFVFIEAKLSGIDLPKGQRIALERLVDASQSEKRKAMGIICEHKNRSGEIDFSKCKVIAYRWNGTWRTPVEFITVKAAINIVLNICGLDYQSS